MVIKFFPSKDATIHEYYPSRNAGLDAQLEIGKLLEASESSYARYNSRILIDFDYVAASRSLVELGLSPGAAEWKLKLYASTAEEIPLDYTIYCYPISGSWSMGVGRSNNIPETTQGVSWRYTVGAVLTSSAWSTASYGSTVTASWQTNPGGGTWFTSSAASQSFSYSNADATFNVSSIVNAVQAGTIAFRGFLIKKSDQDEGSNLSFKSIKFFSKDTSTVFLPVLEAHVNDALFTGSLGFVNTSTEYNIVPTNLKQTYKEGSTPVVRFSARERYPTITFATSSNYLDRYILSGSQYAIYHANSDDSVIEFSEYTKVSHDNVGNFFKLHLDSFQPERYYRILLKVPNSGSSGHEIYDNSWIFKVTRS